MRNNRGQFVKGNHVSSEFRKGNPPPSHKNPDCKCFRCTRISWLKGRKMPSYLIEKIRQRNLNMPQKIKKKISISIKSLWKNPEYKKHMSNIHKGQFQPKFDKSKNWKGDEVKYRALHNWVEDMLGKPRKCAHCGIIKHGRNTMHWANKSQKYIRDVNDWIRLCVKCHIRYDKSMSIEHR